MASSDIRPARAPAIWLYAFLLVQFACQVALIAPVGGARTWLRIATFASSLVMLAVVPFGGRPYPTRRLVVAVIAVTCLGLVHPDLNNLLAGVAQVAFTLAVWAPVFWVTRVNLPSRALRNVFLLVWGFQTLSSVVGVLQVYDPNRFAPDPLFIQQLYGANADGMKVKLADGSSVWRPMGLTDTPGGAALSGQFAFLAGVILAISERNYLLKVAGGAAAVAGMFCIYLCQIRTTVVLTGIAIIVYLSINIYCKRMNRAGLIAVLAAAAVMLAFGFAVDVGGDAVTDRLATLTEDRADRVYYQNRGIFLEQTFDMIKDYPTGAGLGRWGMIAVYFGDRSNIRSSALWAEIQLTGWLYDGGVPLLAVGCAALIGGCLVSIKTALTVSDAAVADWAALVAALNVGAIANTLTYPFFASQAGMMCWVLNGALFAAAVYRQPPTPARLQVAA